MTPLIKAYFDADTFTLSYLVTEPDGRHCAVIDPVLDFDAASGRTGTASVAAIAADIRERHLVLDWILETHAHADHLSGAQALQQLCGGRVGIGERITQVQERFAPMFDLGTSFATDGRQFDHLFSDGEELAIGELRGEVIATPGHTPACVSYRIGDACFVGDTLFMPDHGTARADFPGGDAATLYRSIRRLLALPEATRLFMCHDYQPGGRELQWQSSVAEQRRHNVMIHEGIEEADFVAARQDRDAGLAAPRLILPSLQVNIAAGRLPEPASTNGIRYLKIPLNALGRAD